MTIMQCINNVVCHSGIIFIMIFMTISSFKSSILLLMIVFPAKSMIIIILYYPLQIVSCQCVLCRQIVFRMHLSDLEWNINTHSYNNNYYYCDDVPYTSAILS